MDYQRSQLIVEIAQLMIQRRGPVPDDAHEAYYRGIDDAITALSGYLEGSNDQEG
jgi:hypothetical protein